MRLCRAFQEGERKEGPRLDMHIYICCRLRNEIEDRDEMALAIIILLFSHHRLIDGNEIMIRINGVCGGGGEAILT